MEKKKVNAALKSGHKYIVLFIKKVGTIVFTTFSWG